MIIPHGTDNDARQPSRPHGVVTRAQTDAQNDTAQPPLASGFGALIAKERALQNAIEDSLGCVSGPHGAEIDRALRQQHSQLGANLALLEQRYESLPDPERFGARDELPLRPPPSHHAEPLLTLIARHTDLRADLEALIAGGSDGQRGELILTEVSRSHEELARRLAALLKEDATAVQVVEGDGDRTTRI